MLISGEPGIGKTSLLEHLVDEAHSVAGKAVWGTCWNGDGSPPLWPWPRVLGRLGEDTADAFAELQARAESAGGDPGQLGLFTAVSDYVRGCARAHPVMVVLDDLQWADASCLRLLRFVVRDVRGDPILLAGAFRDGGLPDGHPLRDLLADSSTLHLRVTGLPDSAVAAVLTDASGFSPTPATVARVIERTAGNPFFVREVAHLLATERSSSRLPAAVEDAVGSRILALPVATAVLLGTAALIGRRFEDHLVANAHRLSVSELDLVLGPAVDEHLIEAADPGCHRFVHDLVREYLQTGLGFDDRREAHGRLVRAIEELPDLPMRAARLAAHAVAAVPAIPVVEAVLWCDAAAAVATANKAYEEAVRHLESAVSLSGATGGEREFALASALLRAGRLGEARDHYERLAALAADQASARRLGLAALGLHEVGAVSQSTRAPLIAALDAARVGLTASDEDRRLLARVTAGLARELADGPEADADRARALAGAAIDLARTLDDPATLAACLFARHDVIWGPGTAEERRDLGEELRRVATGHAPDLAFQGALCRYVALLEMGDPTAGTALVEVEDLAARTRQPVLGYLAHSRRDGWDVMIGDPGVEDRIADSFELATRLEVPDAFGVYVTQLVTIDVARADAPAAIRARQEQVGERLLPPDYFVEERSMELIADGDADAAAALLMAAPPPQGRALFRWRALAAAAFGVEAGWRSGATDVCGRAYDYLLPHSGELIVIGGGVSMMGPVDLFLGLAADSLGKRDLARNHLTAALQLARVLGARPWTRRLCDLLDDLSGDDVRVAVFRQEGEVWRLEYAGATAHLPDNKGLRDLAILLANPGQPIASTALAGGPADQVTGSDPVLDDAARAAYRRRIEALDAIIAEARDDGDEAPLQSAEDERDAILAEPAPRHRAGWPLTQTRRPRRTSAARSRRGSRMRCAASTPYIRNSARTSFGRCGPGGPASTNRRNRSNGVLRDLTGCEIRSHA